MFGSGKCGNQTHTERTGKETEPELADKSQSGAEDEDLISCRIEKPGVPETWPGELSVSFCRSGGGRGMSLDLALKQLGSHW